MKERFLRLNKQTGEIENAYGEVLYTRRQRDGKQVYIAPSVETTICNQTATKTVRVCVDWEGPRCTSWKECTSSEDIVVEFCVDFAIAKPGEGTGPWRPHATSPPDPLAPQNLPS